MSQRAIFPKTVGSWGPGSPLASMTRPATLALGFFLCSASPLAGEETRTWKSANGKFSVQATLIETNSSGVTLKRRDGTEVQVPLDALSDEDQQFVSKARLANASPVVRPDELGESVDLLSLVNADEATRGTWTRVEGQLVTGDDYRTQITVPHEIPLEYTLRMTVQLERGTDSLTVGLPMGNRVALMLIDSFDGKYTGVNTVDEMPIAGNPTSYRKRLITDNQKHELVFTVHRRHLRLTLNDRPVLDWVGLPSQLWYNARVWGEEDFPPHRIVLASWKSVWRIHSMELTPIDSSRWDQLPLSAASEPPSQSIALIETESGSGTGFVAGLNMVATNHHVIDQATCDEMRIYLGNDENPHRVERILAISEHDDLAVLEVKSDRRPLPIAWDGIFPKGEQVTIHGNPSIENKVLLRGASVSGTIQSMLRVDGQDYMQVAANVNPGSSGGPILNEAGQVVGVVVRKAVNEGVRFLRDAAEQFDAGGQPSRTSRNQGVALGIPGSVLNQMLQEIDESNSARARALTERHNVKAIIGRALIVARFDYLRLIGNTPDRLFHEAARRQVASRAAGATGTQAATRNQVSDGGLLPPPRVAAAIREYTASDPFRDELATRRETLNEQLDQLRDNALLDASARDKLTQLRVQLSKLQNFADEPSGTFARFERTVVQFGENLERVVESLTKQLESGQSP